MGRVVRGLSEQRAWSLDGFDVHRASETEVMYVGVRDDKSSQYSRGSEVRFGVRRECYTSLTPNCQAKKRGVRPDLSSVGA